MGKSVRELIAGASWETATGFEDLSPKLTLALPTFRRGDNGMLRRAIESVLAQSFADFELIIIDDASTDSTRQIIEEFLAIDARVATIRHARNVGLPTISCNEAILRARAPSVSFVFDDNILEPDALETLWGYHEAHPDAMFIHAIAEAPTSGAETAYFGAGKFEMDRLRIANIIPNGAVLVDRRLFDTVGLYDPHISMIRIADWDLWLRVAAKFEIHQIDRVLVTELGLTQPDSLGNSQPFDPALTREWLSLDRDALLLPSAFLDYDVAAAPGTLSALSRAKIGSLAASRYPWTLADDAERTRGYLLLIYERFSADLDACFVAVGSKLRAHVVTAAHIQLAHFAMYDLIYGANAVVLAGTSELTASMARELRALGIPHYLFLGEDESDAAPDGAPLSGDVIEASEGLLARDSATRERALALGLHPRIEQLGPEPGERGVTVEALLDRHRVPSVTDVMWRMNHAIVVGSLARESVPAGYYTAREFATELSRRLRRNPFTVLGAVARYAAKPRRRSRPNDQPGVELK